MTLERIMKRGKIIGKKKLLVAVLTIVIALLAISFVSEVTTGYGILNLFSIGKGKCISNGFECGDCIDNDGDTLIDYRLNKVGKVVGDPDCSSSTDNTEAPCTPLCNSNADCGTNGYIGDPYCGNDGNVYRNYKFYTCYNPGECIATCGEQINTYLWNYCSGAGCVNGACLPLQNQTN